MRPNMIKYLIPLLTILFLTACVKHESLVSFSPDQAMPQQEEILNQIDLKVQKEDLLKIDVYSFNMEAAAPFNVSTGATNNNNQQRFNNTENLELFEGYFVDLEGNVDLPVVGKVQVEGLTIAEIKSKISELIKPYLKDVVVNVRFLNFKITVAGEVNNPGMIRLTNKRTTILEAIGIAGDLTSYANRTNILIVREEDGVRTYQRLNLQDFEVFSSPYFYVQQNDFIYVEPLKARVATVADPAQRLISYSSGVLSVITLIIALTR